MAFIGPPLQFNRKPAESVVVSNSDLLQGNIEYQMDRSQKILNGQAIREQSVSPRQTKADQIGSTGQNIRAAGQDLLNPEVAKDEGWFSKMLGPLDWLKYLEVPGELLGGAALDILGVGTSKQGKFASWKELGKDDPDKSGWGEFFGRIDNIYDAFEERPMWAQFGIMGMQIAATGGSALAMKAASKGALMGAKGANAMLLARTLKGASYVIDPWEIGWYGAKMGYKGGRALLKTRHTPDGGYAVVNDLHSRFTGDGNAFQKGFETEINYTTGFDPFY